MSDLVHPLYTDIHPPRQFTYPFCYEPHPLCIAAAKEVQRYIEESGVWKDEKGPGKMFGVLCVREKRKSEKVYWQMTFGVIGFGMIIMSKGI